MHTAPGWPLPVITVGELHVHAVAAQEGLAVKGDVHVGRVLDRLTHDDEAGQQRLLVATEAAVGSTAVVDFHLAGAVQDLVAKSRGQQRPDVGRRVLGVGRGFWSAQPGTLTRPGFSLPSRWLT